MNVTRGRKDRVLNTRRATGPTAAKVGMVVGALALLGGAMGSLLEGGTGSAQLEAVPAAEARDRRHPAEASAARAAGGFRAAAKNKGGGSTSGPELVEAHVDEAAGQIVFTFDERVDDDRFWDPGDFFVVTSSGALLAGRHFVETAGRHVVVTFDPSGVQGAVGVVVNDGAVADFQGNPSPPDSLGHVRTR